MCRAFLSPWYERGGMYPADENDVPVFVGRFNLGVVSLNLPMILAKSQRDNTDFYKELDYYLEMIRSLHKRTFEYLGELKASTNPLAYCEGGLYGGNLNPNDKIKPLLKSATASFGITALNELQQLYNGKSLVEDGDFALKVMDYINDKIDQFKEDDGILYAIYGTPAESLCFAGDTMVYSYPENKKIKDLQVNDLVYSYNEKTQEIELKKVKKVVLSNPKAKTITVWFNKDKIICTPDHPFAVKRNDEIVYINAEFLNKKDELVFYNEVKTVSCIEYNIDIKPVYDIEVEDNHNFFAGDNIGVLVHNCGKQVEQFRKEFGIIQNVSSRPYVSNSFHCGVWEDISPIQKQDLEKRFWDKLKGGQIQYVKYPLQYNFGAVRTFVRRAMDYGFYEGVNMSLSYCDDCGYEENDMEVCPRCGSSNLTKIDRMNGYLSYSRVRGDTRLNEAKMAEIKDRKSM